MKRRVLLLFSLFIAAFANAAITVGDNQMWWGYFSESDANNLPYDGNLGYSQSCTIDAAIRIPASETIVSDGTIKAVRFWLGNDISGISGSIRVWIATKQPTASTLRAECRQNIIKSKIVSGLNEVELNTPFEVQSRDIFVGITFPINKKTYPVMSYGSDVPGGFYYRIDNGTWNDFYGTGYGNLALQVLVEAESFPTNVVTVDDFGQNIVLKGERTSMPITITNKGVNPVKSISYTISTDNGEPGEESTKSFSSSPISFNGSKSFNVIFPAEDETRKFQKTLTITKVNGEANTAKKSSGKGFIINLAESKPVTPVIEEFTGTWCGWCPRGTVGMEKVHEAYGDKVVQIAAHYGDIMAIDEYQEVIGTYTSGFPNSITDRQFEADPSYSGLRNALSSAWKRLSQGEIELVAEWEDAQKSAVTFNTSTSFSYSEDDGWYNIAYILTEDGLKGTGSSWAQSNYYSGGGSGGEMDFWYKAGNPVSGVKYNHVAVAAWDALRGVKGSVSPEIRKDDKQTFSFTGDISKNTLIQDKSQLKAIVLLIDLQTGKIVNAAQSDIKEKGTGINSVSSGNDTPAAIYSVDGRKLPTAEKGINIVHMNDGSVKKVLVK